MVVVVDVAVVLAVVVGVGRLRQEHAFEIRGSGYWPTYVGTGGSAGAFRASISRRALVVEGGLPGRKVYSVETLPVVTVLVTLAVDVIVAVCVGICKKDEQKGVALLNDRVETIASTALQRGSASGLSLASRDKASRLRGDEKTRVERSEEITRWYNRENMAVKKNVSPMML